MKPEQKMYLILSLVSGMRDGCVGEEDKGTDYQIASRIYANAFTSLIRHGILLAPEEKDGIAFLKMELEGRVYSCPARAVKNIMREEFISVEERLPEIAPLIREEEDRRFAESKSGKRRAKPWEAGQPMGDAKTPTAPGAAPKPGSARASASGQEGAQTKAAQPPPSLFPGGASGLAGPSAAGETEDLVSPSPSQSPLGPFSRFLPKSRKQKVREAVPAMRKEDAPALAPVPDMIPAAEEETPGERICHTHYVMLKKTYGTQVTGPYTVQVWPTEVIGMHLERTPSGIFVRAQAPNGTIVCRVNEGHAKYIVLEIDNKQFNVFGFWEDGKFITEVAAINKTASIYSMTEEVEAECPERPSDTFLDQFRLREPHRPEFFVVPVDHVSHGEDTVPIAAFIRVKDKNYVISSRGKGNTLLFTYENQLSEISGRWKDGKFLFEVCAVDQE